MMSHKRMKTVALTMLTAAAVLVGNAAPALAGVTVENWTKYEPNNELVISEETLGGSVIAGKMTSHQPVVVWTEDELSEEEQKEISDSFKGNPGVGNPGGFVYISGKDASCTGMTVDSDNGVVRFDRTSNWALIYAGDLRRESEPEGGLEPETESEPENEPETESEPETEPESGPESGSEPENESETESDPENAPVLDDRRELGDGEEAETDTLPEKTTDPEIDPEPEQEPAPEQDPAPIVDTEPDENQVPEAGPETEAKPETKPEPEKISGNTYHSSGSVVSGDTYSQDSRENAVGPAARHVLDDQPETGLLDIATGRVLDDTPKTGMSAEYTVLMVMSVISVLALAGMLIAERKSADRKKK